jgi:hypothetical protein
MQTLAKACTRCGLDKPLGDYHSNATASDGRQSWCKDCTRLHHKAVRYDLTHDEVRRREAGVCDACGSEFASTRDCHIDHDHETEATRGTLCGGCNKALGMVGDDPDRLLALVAYLMTWE